MKLVRVLLSSEHFNVKGIVWLFVWIHGCGDLGMYLQMEVLYIIDCVTKWFVWKFGICNFSRISRNLELIKNEEDFGSTTLLEFTSVLKCLYLKGHLMKWDYYLLCMLTWKWFTIILCECIFLFSYAVTYQLSQRRAVEFW